MKEKITSILPETIRTLQTELNKSQELIDNLKYYSDDIDKRDIVLK